MLLKPLGMNLDAMVEMSSANTSSLSMILYVGIVAPITEELLFRGLILRSFEPHGKGIAVYTSAILFGLFHGNPIQIPFAILTGIILAYTTLEYGIGWAILLHIINNLGLGIIIPEVLEFMPNNGADIVVYGIITAAFIAALILAVVRRERLKEVRMQWKTEPWQRKAVAGSAGIIIISIMCLFDAALMILALMVL